MSKMIFISNRLPVTVGRTEGALHYHESIGGLATGLFGYHQRSGSLWIGWPGMADDDIIYTDREDILRSLKEEYKCIPVFLSADEVEEYWLGDRLAVPLGGNHHEV